MFNLTIVGPDPEKDIAPALKPLHPAWSDLEDSVLVAWYHFDWLAALGWEGHVPATIGRRELMTALGAAAVAPVLCERKL